MMLSAGFNVLCLSSFLNTALQHAGCTPNEIRDLLSSIEGPQESGLGRMQAKNRRIKGPGYEF